MKHSQSLWRGLFFIILITALCGGLALPAISSPARAAPQMQATACVGTTIAQWTFINSNVLPSVGSGTFSVGAGLPAPTFAGGNPDNAVSFNNWTSALDTSRYIDLLVPTSGRSSIGITFDYRSTGTGPTNLELHYSIDGTNFTLFNSASPLNNNSAFHSLSFDLSTITGLDNNATAVFRLYAYGASGAGGTLRLDNITITGNCLTYLTDTAAAANSTGTASALTSTAAAGNLTATASAANLTATASAANLTATASAANLTATSVALSNTPTNTASASTAGIVISEFRTRGTNGANDEFIELYNPTTNAVDISGWKINASNDQGTTGTRATIPASTLLRSGQYYLVANTSTGGYSGTVSANLTYGTGITDAGGVALVKPDNTIVDQVGLGATSAYKEGATLAPLTGTANQSYERKLGGASDSCQDTNDNSADFQLINPISPHNYSSPLSRCGVPGPASLITTTTTITSDTPDPSVVNGGVLVSVTVAVPGSSPVATGKVNITGANANCSITLNSTGKGSCTVIFTSSGSKGLAATYLGDNTHAGSADSESHQVTTVTAIKTPTRVPTPLPPPPLVGINEFVPRPGHDWNNDGVINVGDEYIELLNHGVIDVNLSGYSLDDEVNIGSTPYRLPAITLKPGERHVFYGSETGLLLSDGGDGVRLLKPNGQLVDAYNYSVVRFPDQSYCRLPDNGGLDDWNQNCFPTPGLQNSLSGSSVNPPTENSTENLCPIADTLPNAFLLAECLPFGNNIWNPAYWDKFGWFDERNLPESPGKWPVFAD